MIICENRTEHRPGGKVCAERRSRDPLGRRRARQPKKLSVSKLVCLAVVQVLPTARSEVAWLRLATGGPGICFPYLPKHPRYRMRVIVPAPLQLYLITTAERTDEGMQSPSSTKTSWASRSLLSITGVPSCPALYWWHLGGPRSAIGMPTGAMQATMRGTSQAADRDWAA